MKLYNYESFEEIISFSLIIFLLKCIISRGQWTCISRSFLYCTASSFLLCLIMMLCVCVLVFKALERFSLSFVIKYLFWYMAGSVCRCRAGSGSSSEDNTEYGQSVRGTREDFHAIWRTKPHTFVVVYYQLSSASSSEMGWELLQGWDWWQFL